MLHAVGKKHNSLFLAGDTAQAITAGVVFRFQDVRDVVNRVGGVIEKPRKLWRNYRSHQGVLEFAGNLLGALEVCFPTMQTKLTPDAGLTRGPRPSVWPAYDDAEDKADSLGGMRALRRQIEMD